MKKINAFLVSVLTTAALNAAVIDQVIVRQQWPWSTDVKVEYRLLGVDADHPVDLTLKAYNGDVELVLPSAAVKGDLYGISDGVGTIIIDPVVAFGTEKVALANFKVKLTVSDSAENIGEVVYKVFDLLSGDCTDITRADLYNGKYGAYETEFSAVGKDFNTELDDVLIWTGVTNDVAYKTSKMVMRKIPAKGKSYTMLPGTVNAHTVSFTNDYFVSVFELTEGQWLSIVTNTTVSKWVTDTMYFTNELYRYTRPMTGNFCNQMRGSASWPTGGHENVDSNFPLQRFRERIHVDSLDLLTEALWEYAARAGAWSADLPSGLAKSDANRNKISRWRFNAKSNPYSGTMVDKNSDPTDGTNEVGSYAPNAWGLYDVLGNVAEWCLDVWAGDITDLTGDDPWGPPVDTANKHVYRGGHYYDSPVYPELNKREGGDRSWNWSGIGFRLCLTVY